MQGCVSQVWLSKQVDRGNGGEPRLNYLGDSDAHIVRGLIAILLTLYSGQTPKHILATDAIKVFDEFGFPRPSDAAALQRPACDGRAHSPRCARGAGDRFLIGGFPIYLRRRRCWPRPISLASCERATA